MSERTQTEQAYNELSHRILIAEIAPGERIVEEFWAERLGVNRAAIRESLTRLLGEGLVRQGERGGFFVSEMSDADIRQIREVREILETAAFALACQRATPKQLKGLAETCDDFANFVKKGYLTAAHEADLRFHHLLIEAAGNTRLAQLYQRSRIPLFHRKIAQSRAHPEDFTLTEKEHRSILDAMKKRDAERGVHELRAHFNRGERDALA
ncbi:MAG TPA: GntR family transcriptional regulator [Tepidisphaeraceae bacterium]|jgi:DNA-binding GntR family transcriptional regulator